MKRFIGVSAAALLAMTATATAQENETASDDTKVEETVIVTATRSSLPPSALPNTIQLIQSDELALQAQDRLAARGVATRVVSMPCTQVFDAQDADWRDAVLPAGLPRVAVEAGGTATWYKYVGTTGAVVGIDTYGESAPAGELFKHFGLTADHVAAAVEQIL